MGIKKKSIFLTGASGQLGKAISKKLCDDYDIFNIDISTDKNEINDNTICLDVADIKEVRSLFDSTNPDILINNAGISVFSDFLDRTEDELDHVYNVNLKGTINMINEYKKRLSVNKFSSQSIELRNNSNLSKSASLKDERDDLIERYLNEK